MSAERRTGLLLLLALVFTIVGATIRMTDLETNPPGLWQDEASTGVDAYLLWTTGKDRTGKPYPIVAQSFGDFPLAGYRYLTAPIVGIFGLSAATERFMAALLGTLLIFVSAMFLLLTHGRRAALGAAVSCAFGAMGIMFSRLGSEAMMMPFTLILGATLVELSERRSRVWIWGAALAFAACCYSYHAVKLFMPIWMLGYVVFKWPLIRELWTDDRKHLFGPVALFAVLALPSVMVAFSAPGLARGKQVLAWYLHDGSTLVRVMLDNYLAYFDPGMMFVRGGKYVAQSIPRLGLWNLVDLPLFLIALYGMARSNTRRRLYFFLIYWFLIGPIPGGVTYETHNIGRAIGWLPSAHLISGVGFSFLCASAIERRQRIAQVALALIAVAWLPTGYVVQHKTLVEYPEAAKGVYQGHISDALKCARDNRGEDDQIIVSPRIHAADFFARFWLKPPYDFADRSKVEPGEIYVFPGKLKRPTGREICRIGAGSTLMLVFGAS